jgi:hypothetical protein
MILEQDLVSDAEDDSPLGRVSSSAVFLTSARGQSAQQQVSGVMAGWQDAVISVHVTVRAQPALRTRTTRSPFPIDPP